MEELDDWGLSAEELNFLEEDAIKKISERKASSSSASVSVAPSTSFSSSPLLSESSAASHMNPPSMYPEQPFSRNSSESRYQKVSIIIKKGELKGSRDEDSINNCIAD
ncbi:hypothetical protein BHM03_00010756 [Ensete ventricosum]|nr:hypothetical protein BHM03_00010756 [Ensete ventricosum]